MRKNMLLIIVLSLFSFAVFAQTEMSSLERIGIYELNLVQVSESVVMVHNHKNQGSNMICVALDDGLVFWDCSLFTEIGKEFRSAMEKKYQRKTLALVQSHVHSDHFFGMDAFNDVPYIATSKAKRNFEAQLAIDFEKYKEGFKSIFPLFDKALESAKLRMPSLWFDGELELGSGDSKLILRNAGGHSECSIYAYFEKEKILLVGDEIQVDYYPYFGDQGGDLNKWISILKKWETMEFDYACPGHGSIANKAYLTKTRVFFESLNAKLIELKKKDVSEDELYKSMNAIEKYWPEDQARPAWYNPAIIRAYVKTVID